MHREKEIIAAQRCGKDNKKIRITKYLSRTAQHTVPSKVKKGEKIMKKLINKWLKSEAYTEYCLNIARLYNYHAAM